MTPHDHHRSRKTAFTSFLVILSFIAFSLFLWHDRTGSRTWGWSVPAQLRYGSQASKDGLFWLGVGKGDITGPVVEINFMGYADPNQLGTGVRQRLYSRAFVVGDAYDPRDRFVYLILDTQSGDTAIRDGIIQGLRDLGPEYEVYGQHNVAVVGTHSHSGPGAWLNYLLPQITSKGFDKQSYEAIVSGALRSIQRAHQTGGLGRLRLGKTRVEGANINRSLYAYLANPVEEREWYEDSVDKDMTQLTFTREKDGKAIGILNWFAVHGTSMYGNNTLVTGDNKGVAAYLFERDMRHHSNGADGFVAGFSQSNVGDTSPNVLGPICEDTGEDCDFATSTCGNRSQQCRGRGPYPGLDDGGTQSCFEIGHRQYAAARSLYDSMQADESSWVQGRHVHAVHTYMDFSNYVFPHPNGSIVRTCPAALGYSFAAGTTDGPGAFDFKQNNSGSPNANPFWRVVSGFIHEPSEEQRACHGLKPILLDVGETVRPYAWTPNIVDLQLLRVGSLIIIVSPGEATTMAGRRWRESLNQHAAQVLTTQSPDALSTGGLLDPQQVSSSSELQVVLGGPANSYTHYITTEEEYSVQRYEGASTLYGPHTLNAYIHATRALLTYLRDDAHEQPPPGPEPPINTNRSLSFITGVIRDGAPRGTDFGDVLLQPDREYGPGDSAKATFVGANPRNYLRLEKTYAAVERLVEREDGKELRGDAHDAGRWEVVADDSDWNLVFTWRRTSTFWATSEVDVTWEIPQMHETRIPGSERVSGGTYRLHYWGDHKSLGGTITAFEGISQRFAVVV